MKSFLTLFFVCLCCVVIAAQQNVAKPKAAEALSPELKEQAVALLRRTARDAGSLNLPENRLTFLLATADMLWEHDEKAAREAFQNAKNDVRELIALHVQKMASLAPDDEPNYEMSFLSGDGSMEDTRSIGSVRENLILALGKHDADAAYQFMIETRPVFAPKNGKNTESHEYALAMRGQFTDEHRENNLETRLANIVAANDPTKAFEIAKKRLAVGLFDNAPGVAVKLYLKNKETGAQFASDVFRKVKVAKLDSDYLARSVAFGLLTNGANALKKAEKDAEFAKKPLLLEADLRELAESLARAGLAMKGESYEFSQFTSSLDVMEKYAPGSARQLRAKIEPPKKEAVKTGEDDGENEYRKYAEREKKNRETIEAAEKSLKADEKDFSVKQSKELLGKIKNRTQRIAMTAQLAASLAERGQKEAAAELLKEVREQIPSVPKFWGHYVEHIFVARAYAAVDPIQSFEMLENLISQFDDTLGGLVKFGEFIAGESAVKQSELRLSGMPGMMGMGMIGRVGGSGRSGSAADFASGFEKDIIALAKADFVRMTGLADKFSRPEISLIAKMIIVTSLLPMKDDAEIYPSIESGESDAPPVISSGVTTVRSSND